MQFHVLDRAKQNLAYVLLPTYEQARRKQQQDQGRGAAQTNTLSIKDEPVEDVYLYKTQSPATTLGLTGPLAEQAALQLHNPAVKVKKESQFSWNVVAERMKLVGLARYPIMLDDATRDFTFNRHYLHKLYGGSFVDTFPHPEPARVRVHGLDDFMCLRLDYNPHAPVNPGDPGLLFTYRTTDNFAQYAARVNRLFVRTQASPALWQYMGQYRMYESEPLTQEEFAGQPSLVRTTWAKDVFKRKQGNDVCARVYLRKTRGREPTHGEVSKITQNNERLKTAKSALTWADIAAAYERGEEEIRVYAMKCVGYDAQFQTVLARNYKKFSPPKQKDRSKRNGADPTARKRKRTRDSTTPASLESDRQGTDIESGVSDKGEIDEDDSAVGFDAPEPQYTSKTTRSRIVKRVKLE